MKCGIGQSGQNGQIKAPRILPTEGGKRVGGQIRWHPATAVAAPTAVYLIIYTKAVFLHQKWHIVKLD